MDGITNLLTATTAFVGTHFLFSHPLRAPLTQRFGEKGFVPIYSAVALATFAWFVTAAKASTNGAVWWIADPGIWDLATLVMLFASVLLAGSLLGNPALVDPTLKPRIPEQPRGVLAVTRHPMMWAVTIWALIHVVLWGTAANLVVAGGMGILAFFGSRAQDAKKQRLLGDAWQAYEAKTSFWPFGAQIRGRAPWRAAAPSLSVLIGGTAIWLIATAAHQWSGGPVAGPWRWLQ